MLRLLRRQSRLQPAPLRLPHEPLRKDDALASLDLARIRSTRRGFPLVEASDLLGAAAAFALAIFLLNVVAPGPAPAGAETVPAAP